MSEKMMTVKFLISRFDPEKDEKPVLKPYEISIPEHSDMMLLKALTQIKDEQDESLSFRRSCGEGVCGSDGMNVNGQNMLACITHVSSLKQPITIRPMPGMPIIRDLIVDMDSFYKQYERVEPWLQNEKEAPPTERLQSPEDRAKLDGLYECILCGCCTTGCPSFWWNHGAEDRFAGPAALLAANRFLQDTRDDATSQRLEKFGDPDTLFGCRTIMNCTSVCPKGLNPAKAIGEIRHQILDDGRDKNG